MFIVIIAIVLFIALDIAALRWGFNSRDGLESEEWERRRQQYVRPQDHMNAHAVERVPEQAACVVYREQVNRTRRELPSSRGTVPAC